MDAEQIVRLVRCLGKKYEHIHAEHMGVKKELKQIFDGDDVCFFEPEAGLELVFSARDKMFKTINFNLKMCDADELYTGELPAPFNLSMSQSQVHNALGQPFYYSGPIKMPQPLGQTGGWESYRADPHGYPGVNLVLQYTESLEVYCLVFELADEVQN